MTTARQRRSDDSDETVVVPFLSNHSGKDDDDELDKLDLEFNDLEAETAPSGPDFAAAELEHPRISIPLASISHSRSSAQPRLLRQRDVSPIGRAEAQAGPSGLKVAQGSYRKRMPLPLVQLLALCITRLSEPIAYTQIFPYVNKMVEDMKVTEERQEIGYYSGVIDSIFAIMQLFTVLQWGKLSDRIGRKPVILIGLCGVALSTVLFGFARNFWPAVLARSLAGALSGNSAVVQSVVGEITDETNQAQAFAFTGVSWSLGCIFGPMIGGNFAEPAITFPNTLGTIGMFKDHPYLLPCVISAGITVVTVFIGLIFMKESLPSKVRLDPTLPSPITTRMSEKSSSTAFDTCPELKEQTSVRFILSSKAIRAVFRNYFLLSVCGTACDVVFTLLAYTPVHLGGLSRTPGEIGSALAFSGAAGAVVQVFLFPVLHDRFDSIPLYRFLMLLWPVLFALFPALAFIARSTAPAEVLMASTTNIDIGMGMAEDTFATYPAGFLLWSGIAITLGVFRCASMCYSLNVILIKDAAPSKEALGVTFGLAQTVACVARAGSPAFVSSLFAMTIKYDMLRGQLVWVVMFCVGLAGFWSTIQLEDARAENSHAYTQLPDNAGEVEEECEMEDLRLRQ